MIIDDVTIRVSAGNGGNGKVAFSKVKMNLGPVGGNGGRGGNVYFMGVSNLGALSQFRFKKEAEAPNGQHGKSQNQEGKNGGDLILKIPVGTVIHDIKKNKTEELTDVGQMILMAKGGRGGKGNYEFRGPKNTTPEEWRPGLRGQSKQLRLELKMIADVGFVGLPNVGKSSLLNELTNASSKVANYPFTTLDPHLGVYYDLILADIPGIIEGASDGKGLGIKFLRHIDRTKILFHFISSESEDPIKDYEIIQNELGEHNKELLNKEEYIFLSKTDLIDQKRIKEIISLFKKKRKQVIPISIIDDNSMEEVKKILTKIMDEKMKS